VCTYMLVDKNTLRMLCGQLDCKPAQCHRCYHAASVMRCTPCALRPSPFATPTLSLQHQGMDPPPPKKRGLRPQSVCVCVGGVRP
jgi:hypothetical protein